MTTGAEASSDRERVFVGDVQGCADELEALLEVLRFDPTRHELWFVGDLVNRGPGSARVLRRAIELRANSVLGNHDLHLLRVAEGTRPLFPNDTLQDVLQSDDAEQLMRWLRERPVLHEWDDLVVVHAGLHPAWSDLRAVAEPLERKIRSGKIPIDDPNLRFLTSVRHCDPHGVLLDKGAEPHTPYAPWDHYYRGTRTVVFGHWASRGRVRGERVRGLDSGCVWGGELSAWIAAEDRFVSVPARRAYQQIRGASA